MLTGPEVQTSLKGVARWAGPISGALKVEAGQKGLARQVLSLKEGASSSNYGVVRGGRGRGKSVKPQGFKGRTKMGRTHIDSKTSEKEGDVSLPLLKKEVRMPRCKKGCNSMAQGVE